MTDIAIVGGGIIGLATARDLLIRRPGLSLVVLEKENALAAHQSGRNSGVLHSGLYYRPGSLKARLCRTGAEQMIRFCHESGVDLRQTGKVVVAVEPAEIPRLQELRRRGEENGVKVREIDRKELGEIEPHATAVAALHVPETGVVEFGDVCRALAADVGARGGRIETGARVETVAEQGGRVRIEHSGGNLEAAALVNCAGLYSDRIARLAGLEPSVRIVPFRGEYFDLTGRSAAMVRSAIYPVPDPALPFLGVHLTRRANGKVEAGPNAVLALAREGYTRWKTNLPELASTIGYSGMWRVARRFWRTGLGEYRRSFSPRSFAQSVQELVPEVDPADLRAGNTGVRAQAVARDGSLVDDFVIEEGERSAHVLNAPSPAATSALAIAGYLADRILSRL